MKKTLRFLFAALAAAVGISAQAATDFVGVYEFSSTTTVLNSLNGWEQCAVSDFTFSVDVNKGEDAAKYPYVVKNFLPQKGHPYGVEVNNLKAEVSADGQSLAIVVGDEGLLLDNTPHLCNHHKRQHRHNHHQNNRWVHHCTTNFGHHRCVFLLLICQTTQCII